MTPTTTASPTQVASAHRVVHVEHCMGTVFTIDIRDVGDWDRPISSVVTWLHHVDAVFSTYRGDSAISRIQRGELSVADAGAELPEVAEVLALCRQVCDLSSGAFSATPNGLIDPTGLVKGWAIERASTMLRTYGSHNHAVNGGGDLELAGEAAPGRAWQVGVVDPRNRARIVTVAAGRDFAVATSGTAERGQHIIDPRSGRPATELISVTVAGPSLTFADAYATAAFVQGQAGLDWLEEIEGYEGFMLTPQGTSATTTHWSG